MEIIKRNIWVKITAFILILILSFVTAYSAMVVIANESNGAYEKSEKLVVKDITWHCLADAAGYIHNKTNFYYDDTFNENEFIKAFSGKTIFYDENHLSDFGYAVYLKKGGKVIKDKPVRIVNEKLGESANSTSVTLYKENHINYQLALYMRQAANISEGYESGQIPEEIINSYNTMILMYKYRVLAVVLLIAGTLLILGLAIYLVVTVRNKCDKIKYIPLDLLAFLVAIFDIRLMYNILYSFGNVDMVLTPAFTIISAAALVCTAVTGGAILLIAARIKEPKWWHSTLIYQCLRLLRRAVKWVLNYIIKPIPVIWKSIVCALLFILINFFVIAISDPVPFFVESVGVLIVVILVASMLKKIQTGGRRLANGDFDNTIDTKHMILDIKEHAQNLNSVGRGMEIAVAEQMKSERMRNDLITNVSHDIKTPLTSIINYVDLLNKEITENADDIDEQKLKEYLEVLDRQSLRLKTLTEDLIEASKAASGNVKIHKTLCSVGMLMSQVAGEFTEKSEAAELNIVTDIPEDDVCHAIDGEMMHRVLSNLMSNICKYSQPGTRVYQSLEETADKVIITYRNTSKYELNISSDELMERFVRGDSSRHTEGSGLGLNIAKNLVELQGGRLSIHIDGDLFKVIIEFDK